MMQNRIFKPHFYKLFVIFRNFGPIFVYWGPLGVPGRSLGGPWGVPGGSLEGPWGAQNERNEGHEGTQKGGDPQNT